MDQGSLKLMAEGTRRASIDPHLEPGARLDPLVPRRHRRLRRLFPGIEVFDYLFINIFHVLYRQKISLGALG